VAVVFHRWIQQSAVDGILVDVADYKHVFQGPGIVLVGHECDYSLDLADGRPGMMYTRKRHTSGDLSDRVAGAFRRALEACQVLERESELAGRVRFKTDEVRLVLLDRLRAPNTFDTFQQLEPELRGCFCDWYGENPIRLERTSQDPRQCLSIRLLAQSAANPVELLRRVESSAALVR
jgi:hypothetical protein